MPGHCMGSMHVEFAGNGPAPCCPDSLHVAHTVAGGMAPLSINTVCDMQAVPSALRKAVAC